MKALLLAVLALGCADVDSASSGLAEIPSVVRDYSQGCTWRGEVSDYEPKDTSAGACWHIYTGPDARASLFQLASVCDAPSLPTCIETHGSDLPLVYYDREKHQGPMIIRYERVETLADGSCLPCEP